MERVLAVHAVALGREKGLPGGGVYGHRLAHLPLDKSGGLAGQGYEALLHLEGGKSGWQGGGGNRPLPFAPGSAACAHMTGAPASQSPSIKAMISLRPNMVSSRGGGRGPKRARLI